MSENIKELWLNDLFWGIRAHFWGELSLFGDELSLWRALIALWTNPPKKSRQGADPPFWQCQHFGFIWTPNPPLRGAVKKRIYLGKFSQMWVDGVADSQISSKPVKTAPNHPENRPF